MKRQLVYELFRPIAPSLELLAVTSFLFLMHMSDYLCRLLSTNDRMLNVTCDHVPMMVNRRWEAWQFGDWTSGYTKL